MMMARPTMRPGLMPASPPRAPVAQAAPAPGSPVRPIVRPMRDDGGAAPMAEVHAPHAPKTPAMPKVHSGPINSTVAGRTDHLPVHVPQGAYVIPADVVGHLGESNNAAGFKVLRRMFSGLPRDATETPYSGAGGPYDAGPHPYDQAAPLPYDSKMARGGTAGAVPIVAAGGEHVLTPDEVRMAGAGDLDRGHRVLDKFVLHIRKDLIKTLKKLPGPKRD